MSLSPQFQQPENLTKDRLKQELRKSGVSFDQNENKDYYVRLYRNKILRGGGSRPRSEFSSDEEAVRRSPRSWGKKQLVRTAVRAIWSVRAACTCIQMNVNGRSTYGVAVCVCVQCKYKDTIVVRIGGVANVGALKGSYG